MRTALSPVRLCIPRNPISSALLIQTFEYVGICTLLGLFKDWTCSMAECRIVAGDRLALYTDGITESFNGAEEEFGEERLNDALRQHDGLSPQALLGSIVEEVRRFSPHEQHDDITPIVAKAKN